MIPAINPKQTFACLPLKRRSALNSGLVKTVLLLSGLLMVASCERTEVQRPEVIEISGYADQQLALNEIRGILVTSGLVFLGKDEAMLELVRSQPESRTRDRQLAMNSVRYHFVSERVPSPESRAMVLDLTDFPTRQEIGLTEASAPHIRIQLYGSDETIDRISSALRKLESQYAVVFESPDNRS